MPMKWSRLAALLGVTGCIHGVPAPDFSMPFDSVPPAAILGYLNTLEFDTAPGVGDEQALIVGTCPSACRLGPQVAIQPEKRAARNSSKDLGRPGRIIARMINRDREGYAPYNIGSEDTVYWAVDKVEPVSDRLSRGRSLFISLKALRAGRDSAVLVRNDLRVDEHPGEYWVQSLARWVTDTTYSSDGKRTPGGGGQGSIQFITQAAWGLCRPGSCCHQ